PTSADGPYIRQEARALDASGSDRKVGTKINEALQERAAVRRWSQEKASARKSANKEKLEKVELLADATYDTL
ncbi:hypothetical protein FRC08_006677, partial [Ceratobasidium sp. 394]